MSARRSGTWARATIGYRVGLPRWNRRRLHTTWRPTLQWSINAIKRRMRRIERRGIRDRQRGVVYWQQRAWTW